MKFFNPHFSMVHGNQFIDLQYKPTYWFLYSGNNGIKNVTNIKSADWFLTDFLSNVKVFYIIFLAVYETYQLLTWDLMNEFYLYKGDCLITLAFIITKYCILVWF